MTFKNEATPEELSKYSKVMIDPVKVYAYAGPDLLCPVLANEEITCLTNYMEGSLLSSMAGRYQIVTEPGPGVARIRVALTNMKEARVVRNLIPSARISRTARRVASLEAEVVDSQSGEQLGGYVETHIGRLRDNRTRYLFGLTRASDVKRSIDMWAYDLSENMDISNGKIDPCRQ